MPPLSAWQLSGLGLTLTGIQLLVVAQHPEPASDEPDAAHKPRYAHLVNSRATAGALIATLLCCLPIVWMPAHQQASWLVWGSATMVLVGVDARTTWLPIRATAFAAVSLVIATLVAALRSGPEGLELLVHAGLGAVVAGGLYAALWWISGSLGFGDVRLAAMAGGLAALGGAELWFASLFAGSAAAAAWGLATMVWRRAHPSPLGTVFAYGPGLWLGPWLGWGWMALAGA